MHLLKAEREAPLSHAHTRRDGREHEMDEAETVGSSTATKARTHLVVILERIHVNKKKKPPLFPSSAVFSAS